MLTSSPHNLTPTPIYPSRLPHFNPHLKPTQSHFPTLHAQAEAAVAKEVEKERKARAEHSRMQRAKAPEHPICAPCGKPDDELQSAHSSCASVPDSDAPAAITAAAPAPTHKSPIAM